jgi:hypothetical protein
VRGLLSLVTVVFEGSGATHRSDLEVPVGATDGESKAPKFADESQADRWAPGRDQAVGRELQVPRGPAVYVELETVVVQVDVHVDRKKAYLVGHVRWTRRVALKLLLEVRRPEMEPPQRAERVYPGRIGETGDGEVVPAGAADPIGDWSKQPVAISMWPSSLFRLNTDWMPMANESCGFRNSPVN